MHRFLGFSTCLPQRFTRQDIIGQRQTEQHQGTDGGNRTQQGMHKEDHGEENRDPGRIEHREHTRACKKSAHGLEIPQTTHRGVIGLPERNAHATTEDIPAQLAAHPARQSDHHIGAHAFKGRERQKAHDRDGGQHNQGINIAAAQYPIEDL